MKIWSLFALTLLAACSQGEGSVGSVESADTFLPANPSTGDTNVVYHGGSIASGVPVVLVYWGDAWNTATSPTLSQFDTAARNLITGPFPSKLEQYGVGRPYIKQSLQVPGSPGYFNSQDVKELVQGLNDSGPGTYYCVIMPIGSLYDGSPAGDIGAHGVTGGGTWFGWVGNGDLSTMTRAFGHELVEVATDPEKKGYYVDSLGAGGGEIGDLCNQRLGVVNGVAVEYYWSVEDGACVLPTTIHTFPQTSTLAAVVRNSDVNVFAVGTDGPIYTDWKQSSTWHNWRNVAGGLFQPHTPVTAVSKSPGQLDLFAVGMDGRVYNAWYNGTSWGGWGAVGGGVFFQQTQVSVVSKNPGQLDLFATGEDGRVYTAWFDGTSWHAWAVLGTGVFAKQTPISVVSKNPGQLDVFAVGGDGHAYTAWFNGAWSSWQVVGNGGFFQGTPITSVSKRPGQIDLFATGEDGRSYTAWFDGSWHGWSALGSGVFAARTPIAATSKALGQLDVFAVGQDGFAYTAWYNGTTWGGWSAMGGGRFAQNTPLAVASHSLLGAVNIIDVFGVGMDNRVYTNEWFGFAGWSGWRCVL